MRAFRNIAVAASLAARLTNAIELDINDSQSIKSTAKTLAEGIVSNYYTGKSEVPGLLPEQGYYWWNAGNLWDGLINYWHLTGDDQFNSVVSEALLFQTGPDNNFMPLNQSAQEGNDDQAVWALAALSAAERSFPNPPQDRPQWIDLAKNVFENQAARWDNATCEGGLRWMIFPFSTGYDYKQSQAYFFLLAARLAQFTKNETYSQWASQAYDWSEGRGLVADDFSVYDGASATENCSKVNKLEWSYNQAAFLYGSAIMYNLTSADTWRDRVNGHTSRFTSVFFHANGSTSSSKDGTILFEVACEAQGTCSSDQKYFKAVTARWISQAAVAAPFTADKLRPLLKSSAEAAAKTCTGGKDGSACGDAWYAGSFKGDTGLPEQLSALEVIQQNLNTEAKPLSSSSGSTSTPNSTTGGASTTGNSTAASPSSTGAASVIEISGWVVAAGAIAALL